MQFWCRMMNFKTQLKTSDVALSSACAVLGHSILVCSTLPTQQHSNMDSCLKSTVNSRGSGKEFKKRYEEEETNVHRALVFPRCPLTLLSTSQYRLLAAAVTFSTDKLKPQSVDSGSRFISSGFEPHPARVHAQLCHKNGRK